MSKAANRIGYIDAMRGFTMILVVFSHIYLHNYTPLNQFFITFRMPLFFFVSGFISFRLEQAWEKENYRNRVKEKLRTLILPALFFGTIYSLVTGLGMEYFVMSPMKSGFWFTISLFEMLLIYYTVRRINTHRAKRSLGSAMTRLYLAALLMFVALPDMLHYIKLDDVICLSNTVKYFQFFAFGMLCSCFRERFFKIIDGYKYWHFVIAYAIYTAIKTLVYSHFDSPAASESFKHIVTLADPVVLMVGGYLGIMTIFGIFRRLQSLFPGDRGFAPLQYVGRHTLEVYMLHGFLLINFTTALRPYIVDDPILALQLIVGIGTAAAITTLALIVGRILTFDAHIHYFVLGARGVRPQSRLRNLFSK